LLSPLSHLSMLSHVKPLPEYPSWHLHKDEWEVVCVGAANIGVPVILQYCSESWNRAFVNVETCDAATFVTDVKRRTESLVVVGMASVGVALVQFRRKLPYWSSWHWSRIFFSSFCRSGWFADSLKSSQATPDPLKPFMQSHWTRDMVSLLSAFANPNSICRWLWSKGAQRIVWEFLHNTHIKTLIPGCKACRYSDKCWEINGRMFCPLKPWCRRKRNTGSNVFTSCIFVQVYCCFCFWFLRWFAKNSWYYAEAWKGRKNKVQWCLKTCYKCHEKALVGNAANAPVASTVDVFTVARTWEATSICIASCIITIVVYISNTFVIVDAFSQSVFGESGVACAAEVIDTVLFNRIGMPKVTVTFVHVDTGNHIRRRYKRISMNRQYLCRQHYRYICLYAQLN